MLIYSDFNKRWDPVITGKVAIVCQLLKGKKKRFENLFYSNPIIGKDPVETKEVKFYTLKSHQNPG